jgi:ribonuclease-3
VTDDQMAELARRLHVEFVPAELLRLAFRHTSYVQEHGLNEIESNQRLEYLGDAVLDLVLAAYLYEAYPDLPEGDLTRRKAALARQSALAAVARELDLGRYLLLGRGEEAGGGRRKASLLADALEALIGAVFLAGGYEAARDFVLRSFARLLDDVMHQNTHTDHKSALQELMQSQGQAPPEYVVVGTAGPPHARRFTVQAVSRGRVIGSGRGSSKRAAEQRAAAEALEHADEWLKRS